MGGYEELIAGIKAVVRRNGRREITGDALQQVLVGMVSAIGANSAFAGVATPDTDPGSPDANVFWIAATPGTYAHFGNAAVTASAILSNETGSWVATPLNFGEPYRPFPDFYFYNRVLGGINTKRETISVDGKGDFVIQTVDSYINIGLDRVSEQEAVKMEMRCYPYRGRGHKKGFFPFRTVHSVFGIIDFDNVYPYKYGVNVQTTNTGGNLLTHAGLYGVGGNLTRSVMDSVGAALKGEELPEFWLRAYGDDADSSRRIKILNSDVFRNLPDKNALGKLKYPIPLITLRMGARLFRGGEEAGPMKTFRVGVYAVDPRGFGETPIEGADIYVRLGMIREMNKAYNNGEFL